MNSKLLSLLSLCIVILAIPMALRGAEKEVLPPELIELMQNLTQITWTNDTNSELWAYISSSNEAYEDLKAYFPAINMFAHERVHEPDGTIMENGPYRVTLTKKVVHGRHVGFEFTIPNITGPTEIRITENPEGSGNYQVWYRDLQTVERSRQEALAVMQATHKILGKEAVSLGGEETYKQIAEYLLELGWQQARPAPH